ncbi:GlsB/YeaQ/YmgE family stress response membrane protein [Bartonella sp. TP]|uniref:GlsB/YeaQ/YmgE family stress response membrane protein n=1 Tax=Bartonella sp. TP TaxID=3057550 RepID=UPI0025AF5669|nr:GlsB/YeaQ/YmgE family stress response membrane protein [Bartonella sp. TP]MDN5249505.1 GlsB/YeaQ/YmgE family stress response membrane protein [Alphaproteobacteria bacterium]WJW79741.1 GlsB/YeaQ/YmgE family stress response membrane protein [Bartonella sp. TP]
MDDKSIGWLAAIIIGGLAGWMAQRMMHTNTGIFLNIILGIVGASIATFVLGMIGVHFAGWFGYLIAGFIGACALIFIGRQLGL